MRPLTQLAHLELGSAHCVEEFLTVRQTLQHLSVDALRRRGPDERDQALVYDDDWNPIECAEPLESHEDVGNITFPLLTSLSGELSAAILRDLPRIAPLLQNVGVRLSDAAPETNVQTLGARSCIFLYVSAH